MDINKAADAAMKRVIEFINRSTGQHKLAIARAAAKLGAQ